MPAGVVTSVLIVMLVVTALVPVTLAEVAAQVGRMAVDEKEPLPVMVQVRATGPVNPFRGVTTTVEVPGLPAVAMLTGVAERVKPGTGAIVGVTTVMLRVCITVPAAFWPVTARLYVPAAMPADASTTSVELPNPAAARVTVAGFR